MTKKIPEALYDYYLQLDRRIFMDDYLTFADKDMPLPIGYGQTISQPSLVLEMTALLELDKTCHVLEIGTGSGYQTAFLAKFGKDVISLERLLPLHEKVLARFQALAYDNITFLLSDGSLGYPSLGPYDRILVTAASRQIPEELILQLKVGGIMVIPVGNSQKQELLKVVKISEHQVHIEAIELVQFVPLVGKYSI